MKLDELFHSATPRTTVWKKRNGTIERVSAPAALLAPRKTLVAVKRDG